MHWQIGDVKVTLLREQEPHWPGTMITANATVDALKHESEWLSPFVDDKGKILLSIHALLVESEGRRILVDTCVGNDKPRPGFADFNNLHTPFLADMEKAGVSRDSVDTVICTHLHLDHVGWNTMLVNGRWVPTFPKAKYIMADRELTHWTQKEKDDPSAVPWITDSVLPIVEAKRAQIVKSDFVLNESIQFIPTPGHTIDHYSVLVGQPGQDAFITGDMIHSPIQGKYPELGMRADYDSRQAGQTRRKVFDRFCDTSTIMCVVHFPSPSTGRVRRWSDGYKFVA